MPSINEIIGQIKALTGDLIELGLCDWQTFPVRRDLSNGISEIGIPRAQDMSFVLRNVPYSTIYDKLAETENYNIKMLDGAIIQMSYQFKSGVLIKHRLAFFPSPHLEEFQNNPEIYESDEVYADVIMKNIVPFPLRFDFDATEGNFKELDHPKSHLTLGHYKRCRIPVCSPLTPYHFISFLLRNFYHTAYSKHCESIQKHDHFFDESIFESEKRIIHIKIPSSTK